MSDSGGTVLTIGTHKHQAHFAAVLFGFFLWGCMFS